MKKLKTASAAVGRVIRAVGVFLKSNSADLTMVAGVGAISYGAGLVYMPAGFIVGGALVLVGGVLSARKSN